MMYVARRTRILRILSASRTIEQSISRTGVIGDVVRRIHARTHAQHMDFMRFWDCEGKTTGVVCRWVDDVRLNGKYGGSRLFEGGPAVLEFSWRDWEKSWQISVRITQVPAEMSYALLVIVYEVCYSGPDILFTIRIYTFEPGTDEPHLEHSKYTTLLRGCAEESIVDCWQLLSWSGIGSDCWVKARTVRSGSLDGVRLVGANRWMQMNGGQERRVGIRYYRLGWLIRKHNLIFMTL
jgi:hypothetical protein